MGLLKPAINSTAFMKVGIMGFAGSGKTFTTVGMAIELNKLIKQKQIAFFDTEKGSDFAINRVKKEGMELLIHKGRAFKDLIDVIDEVEKGKIPILIIDSISHVWRELCDSFKKKQNRKFLTMGDWGVLKGQWQDFTDRYINSSVHIFMLGRAGHTFEQEVSEDGKKEMVQTGTKMKVEGETAFEPDLLLEMYRIEEKDRIVNRCFVVKDRTNTVNGKSFDYPTLKNFEQFLKELNVGGAHVGVDTTRTSQEMFESPDHSFMERRKNHEIALEKVKESLVLASLDGHGAEAKKKRAESLISAFGTSAWTEISGMKLEMINDGLNKLNGVLGLVTFDKEDVL